jgi:ubiquitin C-terminal hydrolase
MGFNAIGEVLFTTESEFNSENEFYNQILDKFKVIDLNESNKATSKLLETLNDSETNIMEVKKISPTKYKLIIETNRPFLLSFTESFDHSNCRCHFRFPPWRAPKFI